MAKVRVAQIGVAHDHASGFMESVRRLADVFEVVGVAEPDEANKLKFGGNAVYGSLKWLTVEDILGDDSIDAVLVETDDWKLVPYGLACVQAGKHLHLDKPSGESVEQYETLMAVARQRNLVVQLGYMYRYNPAIMYAMEAVRSGKLGEIHEVNAVMNTYHSREKREWLAHFKGGIMHYLGCHMVDCLINIMGKPEEIISFCDKTHADGVDAVDRGFAVFRYKNGISTAEATSIERNGYARRQLVVIGSKGTIEIKPLENPTRIRETYIEDIDGNHYRDNSREVVVPELAGRYDTMMLDFAEMVRGNKENPFTYEYELLVHRACLKSCGFDVAL
ncbi:Gfo/Idh/MocA family protein [Paenibacillus cymbidii]|uniref:Gfo/Idh/MocA family protein n=1 Tax=Paenibacillus cymbidii TaxID=1639034 RepID=UPI0014367251|nr:Gfo/Idh/MocA family oxidoreductase [Paenibacillus cymbidii]